jgi:hypothetical protein
MNNMKEGMATAANAKNDGKDKLQKGIKGCNIEVTQWKADKIFIRLNPNPHVFGYCACKPDGGISKATFAEMSELNKEKYLNNINPKSYVWAYTFTFRMAIPGTNMHFGNRVFDYMNRQSTKYCMATNVAVGSGKFVPAAYWANEGFRPMKPVFESVNVTSIELTYVAAAKTHAPTPKSTMANKDCQLSEWSAWTKCSKTCGTGVFKRQFRMLIANAEGNGKACGKLVQSTACTGLKACPVDCAVSAWSAWSKCDKTCVTDPKKPGFKAQTRTVTTKALNGGKACPAVSQKTRCYLAPCPVDCKLSAWSEPSRCSAECTSARSGKAKSAPSTSRSATSTSTAPSSTLPSTVASRVAPFVRHPLPATPSRALLTARSPNGVLGALALRLAPASALVPVFSVPSRSVPATLSATASPVAARARFSPSTSCVVFTRAVLTSAPPVLGSR